MKIYRKKISFRHIITAVLIISEIIFSSVLLRTLCSLSEIIRRWMYVFGVLISVKLIITKEKTAYTVLWILFLAALPSQSWFFYCIFNKKTRYVHPEESSMKIFRETETKYYSCGEKFFSGLLLEIGKASKYIYLEYFIINEGVMWDSLVNLLMEKAGKGVEVRIIYDDMCSLLFSKKKICELGRHGITAVPFNRMNPFPDIGLNRRNHRKIAVIDGVTAFTGGINISDEYINMAGYNGNWKDAAVMIKGPAAGEMANNFAETWYICTGQKLFPEIQDEKNNLKKGFLIPFEDSPFNKERLSKLEYMKHINCASEYVYVMTPYLIPDNDMTRTICLAAERGIDVRIITPYLPDKKLVHLVTRSYYMTMMKSGVRIYEYSPGFIHSKALISDDNSAVIGSANFDYRSFYLLFENSVILYNCSAVEQIKNDFENTFRESREITADFFSEISSFDKFFGKILKLFSCIM